MTLTINLLERGAGRSTPSLPPAYFLDIHKCFNGKSNCMHHDNTLKQILLYLQVRPLKCLQNLDAMFKRDRSNPSRRSPSIPSTRWIIINSMQCTISPSLFFLRIEEVELFLLDFSLRKQHLKLFIPIDNTFAPSQL